MMKLLLLIIMAVSMLILFPQTQAFAQGVVVTPSVGWYWNNFVEDIEERAGFGFDCLCSRPVAELQAEHSERQQALIDELGGNGYPIPFEFEQRRAEKLGQAVQVLQTVSDESMNQQQRTTLEIVVARLQAISEINEIRILHSQIPQVINSDDATKQRFNDRVNNLQSWQEFCTGEFDIDNYKQDRTGWQLLKDDCSQLGEWERQYGYSAIKSYVIGRP